MSSISSKTCITQFPRLFFWWLKNSLNTHVSVSSFSSSFSNWFVYFRITTHSESMSLLMSASLEDTDLKTFSDLIHANQLTTLLLRGFDYPGNEKSVVEDICYIRALLRHLKRNAG